MSKQDFVRPEAILDNWSEHPWTNGLQVERLQAMEKLEVRTRNSLYEITIIDGLSGEILVRGGPFFPELTPANLQGATLGRSICKLRGIYEGFRMELNVNGERAVTTPVESIEVLEDLERDRVLGRFDRSTSVE
ncbi:MAG TPA: hypothetical protein VEJ45_05110 [Candidatus Acidoferrales bacterium]|nr:hypothetical protein [Candidatus Acidoferrales bacterium]